MTNEHADDGLIEVRETTTTTDRTLRQTCERCGAWVTYRGVGRRPRYCSPSCRQRAYEIRTATAREGSDRDAGRLRDGPVREVVERTETVTRTVVRHALPWKSGPLRAPVTAGEWARTLATLCQLVPRGHLQTQREWPEMAAAIRQLAALLEAHPGPGHAVPARAAGLADATDYVLADPQSPPARRAAPPPQPKRRKKRRR